jgi:tocopherol O-methyltransferase
MSLNQNIVRFYDASTPLWLNTWGEHMHHGYYADPAERKDHRQAQLDLIEELLAWGRIEAAQRILDAGCGVGGSSRYLAQRFGARVEGVTLSPVQAARAQRYNERAQLTERVETRAQDVFALRPETQLPYDLVWSLESAEHMADKAGLLRLFYDLLAPGGRLILVTWCKREFPPRLRAEEEQTLAKIQSWYHLPPLVPLSELESHARVAGFEGVETADWSENVAPFWGAVIRSALDPRNWPGLLAAGAETIRGAWAMRYMQRGFRQGSIRFGLLRAQKPLRA